MDPNPLNQASNVVDPLGLFGGGNGWMKEASGRLGQAAMTGMQAKPKWWDNSTMGNWSKWATSHGYDPLAAGLGDVNPSYLAALKQFRAQYAGPIDLKALQAASQDTSGMFYGIDFSQLDPQDQRVASAYLSGNTGLKDKMMVQAMADAWRARQAKPLIGENETRNQMVDLWRQGQYDWQRQQRGMEEAASGRGMVDSGSFGRSLSDAMAASNARTQGAIMDTASQHARTNFEYQQSQLQSAIQNLMGMVQLKRGNRRMRERWLNQAMQLKSLADAQARAQQWGTLGSMAGAAGSMMGSYGR